MENYDFIVIGAGVTGTAIAYNLAKMSAGKILIVERQSAAQANTSLAAGLLTLSRKTSSLIKMVKETYHAISEIQDMSGLSLGMHQHGSLYSANLPERQKELVELVRIAVQENIEVEWLDISSAKRMVPWLELPENSITAYMPDDAYIDGYSLAGGYLKEARTLGVELLESTPVIHLDRKLNQVTGVEIPGGHISSGMVIDAAGVWAGLLARDIGAALPMAPVRSQYWITSDNPNFKKDQPFVILPEARAYLRPESSGMLFGLREKESVVVAPEHLPEKMSGYRFKQDQYGWDSLLEGLPVLSKYFPMVENIEIANYISGFSTYTPDGMFALGEVPSIEGFLAATGCCGSGIAMSGGIGRAMAELALGKIPSFDLHPHRIDRFGQIDPSNIQFLHRCAMARSGKVSG